MVQKAETVSHWYMRVSGLSIVAIPLEKRLDDAECERRELEYLGELTRANASDRIQERYMEVRGKYMTRIPKDKG